MKNMIALFLILTTYTMADEEAIGFGINDFNHCTASNLYYSRGFADRFIDAFQDKKADGKWDVAIKKYDEAVDAEDFADHSKTSEGNDDASGLGVDHADVGFISSHGSAWWTTGLNPNYVIGSFTMGENWHDGNQWRSSVNTTDEIQLGDDLEIFVAATCKSAQYSAWTSGGVHRAWKPGKTIQFWLGFHGISYDSMTDRNRVRIYAKNSFYDGIGANWVEELTRGRGLSPDQCATVIIRGSSENKITTNFEYGGFADRGKDYNGSWSIQGYFYVGGCAPKGGPKL